jgi:hypothetical protein
MYKLLTYSGYDNRFGPHIFPIEPDLDRTISHIKMARELPPDIERYMRAAAPIPGKTQLLLDAMGSSDYYGSNVNGDYFPTEALDHKGPDYGVETFMHYAYPYKFHVNKDVARAYGDKVTLADYDRKMQRVLLIVCVDDSKCSDILTDLANNKYWDVSMGCRVPWDECSICHNRARNRGEYCAHLRMQMNRILDDGRRVCAFNRLPKFFDISFVPIGAEKASHVLAKVAHQMPVYEIRPSAELGEIYYGKLAEAEKRSTEQKNADITKNIPTNDVQAEGVTPQDQAKMDSFMDDASAVKADEPVLPNQVLDALGSFPLKQVFTTLAALGIDLRPEEFQRIVLIKQGAKALAEKLAQHRLVFDATRPAEQTPTWARELEQLDIRDASEKIAMLMRPYLSERSCYPEILAQRLQRMEKRADPTAYNQNSQWYPMTDEGRRLSSGVPGLVPASVALAAGFMVFRKAFPQLIEKSPAPIRTLAAHPWMLPLLIGAGVGATVGLSSMSGERSFSQHGTGTGLDGKNGSTYHQPKVAGVDPVRFGPIALAYIHSGAQQKMMGSTLTKHASFSPRTTCDVSIFESVRRLARRKKESHDHAQ